MSLASCPSALQSGSFCQLSTSGKKLLIMAFSHTHTCFLDMATALDRVVNHSLLALKLRRVGVYGVELGWFDSYLCGRSICTNVNGVQSSMQSISSGVPQGSILGPLLFIIFYHDLPAVSTSKTAMFADDTLIHDCCKGVPATSSSASVCTCSRSRDLQLISDWADEWQTSFNASKTVHMLFRRKHRHHTPSPSPALLLNSNEIPFAESTRHLGVALTSTLSWSEHISNIIQRQQFKIFVLKRLARRRGAEDVVKRLYVGVVRPALEFASALWEGCLRRETHHSGTCPSSYCTLCSSLPPPRSSQLGGAETNRLAHSGVASPSQ